MSVHAHLGSKSQPILTSINDFEINASSLSDLLIVSRSSEFQTTQRVLIGVGASGCSIKDEVRNSNNHVAIGRRNSTRAQASAVVCKISLMLLTIRRQW
jgi:glutamyl-tRNA reductase